MTQISIKYIIHSSVVRRILVLGGFCMKGLYFDGTLKYSEELEKPIRQNGEALIKVTVAAVCNTDKEIIKGYKGFKGILGHEFVGIVEEADDKALIGKRVTGDINIGCGTCAYCKVGLNNHCETRKVLGIYNKNGAFADYITLPIENLFVVPENLSDYEAVFAEILAAAVEITELNHITPASSVAIIGDGKLGRMIAQVIALTGCELTVIGRFKDNLALLSPIANTKIVQDVPDEKLYDFVIDCTGNKEGLLKAQKIVKPLGTIILKSTYHGKAEFNPSDWVVNEVTIKGSRCGPTGAALRLMSKGFVKLDYLFDKVYSLKDYTEAFDSKNRLKAIFDMRI